MDPTLTAAAIGVGGTVIVGIAGFWANVRNTDKITQLTEQGQLTERYSKAIEQLGSDKVDVRIGGIYALERIARDSPRDHPTIMEVLAAFIRDHSQEQWPPARDDAQPPPRTTRPDVQAATTVIGRRTIRHDSQPINLQAAVLAHAYLGGANLIGAFLADADLTNADLGGANLTNANLTNANLEGANLEGANLEGANLTGANLTSAIVTYTVLTRANFTGAKLPDIGLAGANLSSAYLPDANLADAALNGAVLTGAYLVGANLTGAFLVGANLTGANLAGANLTSVDLGGAELTSAKWPLTAVVPEGWERDPDSGRLKRADTDSGPAAPATAT